MTQRRYTTWEVITRVSHQGLALSTAWRSPSPRFLDPEFRELDSPGENERKRRNLSRSLSQELVGVDSGGTGCPIPGLSGVLTASSQDILYIGLRKYLWCPRDTEKRIEVDMEPSLQVYAAFLLGCLACFSQYFKAYLLSWGLCPQVSLEYMLVLTLLCLCLKFLSGLSKEIVGLMMQ